MPREVQVHVHEAEVAVRCGRGDPYKMSLPGDMLLQPSGCLAHEALQVALYGPFLPLGNVVYLGFRHGRHVDPIVSRAHEGLEGHAHVARVALLLEMEGSVAEEGLIGQDGDGDPCHGALVPY